MISSVLLSIVSFIVLLSIVVIAHEYGHYKTGLLLGIGVERFAVGFGPALYKWRRKKGENDIEYRINAIPLGGYVKFVGENRDDKVEAQDSHRAFNLAPVWKRVLTVFAGPFMNMVLGFFLFCVIFLIGFPAPAATVGEIRPDSPAEIAGLKVGDRVVAIDGKELRFWHEFAVRIADNPEVPMVLTVERPVAGTAGAAVAPQRLDLPITPSRTVARHPLYMFETERGEIGIKPIGYAPLIGIADENSPAYRSGLRTGDLVMTVNDRPIRFFSELAAAPAEVDGPLKLTVARGEENIRQESPAGSFTAVLDGGEARTLEALGIESGELFVYRVEPESPAEKAGLKTGDRLQSLSVPALPSWDALFAILQPLEEQRVVLQIDRQGEKIELPLPEGGPEGWNAERLGLSVEGIRILSLREDGPARQTDLRENDKLVGLFLEPLSSWVNFTQVIRACPNREVAITVRRDGASQTLTAMPKKIERLDDLNEKVSYGQIGVWTMVMHSAVPEITERYWNPLKIFARGMEETWTWTVRLVESIYYIFSGKVSTKSLGGPIMIARLAGESSRMGLIQFLMLVAIISFNLAFINLFPIPILDGGNLLLFTIEAVKGKPLSDRAMGVALRFGLLVIAALFMLIFYNDFRWLVFKVKEVFIP